MSTPKHTLPYMMALSLLGLSACSTPESNQQHVHMCQALAEDLLGTPQGIVWGTPEKNAQGYDGLVVNLNFTTANGQAQQASCHYEYIADDDGISSISDPMAAYERAPDTMSLNKQSIPGLELIKASKNVMVRQGKEMVETAKQTVQDGAEIIQEKGTETLQSIQQQSTETLQSIQENASELKKRVEVGIDAGVNYQAEPATTEPQATPAAPANTQE